MSPQLMSTYDGCYIRLADSQALWAVDIGHRRPVESPALLYEIGLRPQHIVTEDELDAIPFLVPEEAAKHAATEASDLFACFSKYSRIIVTGPQRSGTTIAANMIAHDTDKHYIDEWDFGATDPDRWRALVMSEENYVMQAPCMCRYVHEFGKVDGLAIVLMRRPVEDIIASERRIGMPTYNPELKRYGKANGVIDDIKYRYWDEHQVDEIQNVYELPYAKLKDHSLYVPISSRRHFAPKQWKPE